MTIMMAMGLETRIWYLKPSKASWLSFWLFGLLFHLHQGLTDPHYEPRCLEFSGPVVSAGVLPFIGRTIGNVIKQLCMQLGVGQQWVFLIFPSPHTALL